MPTRMHTHATDAYFDRIRVQWQRSHAFLEEEAWGIQAEYLDLPLGYASDTLWTQARRACYIPRYVSASP